MSTTPTTPNTPANALIQPTESGLYCPPGNFFIDPWRPVDLAIVSHAHADHARSGCGAYLTSAEGTAVLQARLGSSARIESLQYGEQRTINGVTVSLHPAGHILGSSQIRVEHHGEVWVFSGDYKTQPDPTCSPFEPVRCHTFITECTFGLPLYQWRPQSEIMADINAWWRANQERDRTTAIFAWSLGKAQRLLAGLDPTIGPILVHGAVANMLPAYRAAGVALPPAERANEENAREGRGRAIVIAPPSAIGTPWMKKFGDVALAFASGWMAIRGARRWRSLDRGFALSDHVDWPGLLSAIDATGAQQVGVTHGNIDTVVRYLNESGKVTAYAIPTRYKGETLTDEQPAEAMPDADAAPEAAPASDEPAASADDSTPAQDERWQRRPAAEADDSP